MNDRSDTDIAGLWRKHIRLRLQRIERGCKMDKIANAFLATWQWTKNQLKLPNLAATYSFAWEEPHPINPSPPMERDLIFTLYSSSVEADIHPINRPIGHFHAFHVPSILPFNQVLETFQMDGSPSELELNPHFHMIWLPQGLFLQFYIPQTLSCQFSTALSLVNVRGLQLLASTIQRRVCLVLATAKVAK